MIKKEFGHLTRLQILSSPLTIIVLAVQQQQPGNHQFSIQYGGFTFEVPTSGSAALPRDRNCNWLILIYYHVTAITRQSKLLQVDGTIFLTTFLSNFLSWSVVITFVKTISFLTRIFVSLIILVTSTCCISNFKKFNDRLTGYPSLEGSK